MMKAEAISQSRLRRAWTVAKFEWLRWALFYFNVFYYAFYGFLCSDNLIDGIPGTYLDGLHPEALDFLIKILAVFLGAFGFFGALLDFTSNYLLQLGLLKGFGGCGGKGRQDTDCVASLDHLLILCCLKIGDALIPLGDFKEIKRTEDVVIAQGTKNVSYLQIWGTYQFILMVLAEFAIIVLDYFDYFDYSTISRFFGDAGIGFMVTLVILAIFFIYRSTTLIIIMAYRNDIIEDELRRNNIQQVLVKPDSSSSV